MECVACGRRLTNDIRQPNAAAWTLTEPRQPYCRDSRACQRDAEADEEYRRRVVVATECPCSCHQLYAKGPLSDQHCLACTSDYSDLCERDRPTDWPEERER